MKAKRGSHQFHFPISSPLFSTLPTPSKELSSVRRDTNVVVAAVVVVLLLLFLSLLRFLENADFACMHFLGRRTHFARAIIVQVGLRNFLAKRKKI